MRRSNGWTVTCLAAGSLALAVTHSGAHAACFQDAPQIAWSYPSHGDTDVPIDADIFVMVNTFGPPPNRITVNDVEVDSSGVGHFDPGPLAPNTAYRIVVEIDGLADPSTQEVLFTTGTEVAAVVGAPTAPVIQRDDYPPDPTSITRQCRGVLETRGCYDTHEDTLVRAEASATDVVVWRLESLPAGDAGPVAPHVLTTWPAECGPPLYVTHRERWDTRSGCLRVTAVGGNGVSSHSSLTCPSDSSGCSVRVMGHAHRVWLFAPLTVLVAWRARRRQRPAKT
ncbi:MAG: hypothetical protein IPL19_29130 [Sandaracinaceae bacterium]|nr:hypothetical protein [Sandaracinaceae bacterium]MBK7775031.1 hypothetical protein [Sandaracinaceae bacterium]MBK8412026.1 hypothetical protein [Sandaracinaceae bacterium]MBK8591185.1 hypothetical protein [Sandaracinaceae bacterium]